MVQTIYEISDLTEDIGTRIRVIDSMQEVSPRSRFDKAPFTSFDDFLTRSRVILVEGEGYKMLNIPDPRLYARNTRRGEVERNHPYLFWHYDAIASGFNVLLSDDSDFTDQPVLKFADLGDVINHLQGCIPELAKSIGTSQMAASYLGNRALEKFNECYRAWVRHQNSITEDHLPLLRSSALAFLELLNTKDPKFISNNFDVVSMRTVGENEIITRASPMMKFSYIIHQFQNIPAVSEFLDNSHQVQNAFTHYFGPDQTLIWNGEDYMLAHMRVPQKQGIYLIPLKRAMVTYQK